MTSQSGFGFVEFEDESGAKDAIGKMDGRKFLGRRYS